MRPLNRLSHDSARFRTTFGHEPLTHTGHSFSIDSSSMIQSPTTDLTTTDHTDDRSHRRQGAAMTVYTREAAIASNASRGDRR